jgi:hypothetical protein
MVNVLNYSISSISTVHVAVVASLHTALHSMVVEIFERTPGCGNLRSEEVLKAGLRGSGRGCSSWVMSLMFSAEKTKAKRKNSWNN